DLAQVRVLRGPRPLDRDRAAPADAFLLGEIREPAPLPGEDGGGELLQVVAVVAALGNFRRAARALLRPRPQRAGQLVDLGPAVVHVELARPRVAGPLE